MVYHSTTEGHGPGSAAISTITCEQAPSNAAEAAGSATRNGCILNRMLRIWTSSSRLPLIETDLILIKPPSGRETLRPTPYSIPDRQHADDEQHGDQPHPLDAHELHPKRCRAV